jgi:peptidoglycan/xylan/chitin deacetylase (PgdA/CDA1 family)
MDYMRQNFNVISEAELLAWLRGEQGLPPRAAMITFDDGYQDNWANAYPILRARNLPAIIFLTTNYIEKNTPFYWDTLAYVFRHTKKDHADLPLIGEQSWQNDHEMEQVMLMWAEAAKLLPESEKEKALQRIPEILDVLIPENAFQGLHLSWDQVREMAQNGIEMGSHTISHPILTRISIEQVKEELVESKKRIEAEIGMPVKSFAYPNGGVADFTPRISGLLRESGYHLAFSLIPGPTSFATVKENPYAIRRIFLLHADSFSRFVGKMTGLARFFA